MPRVTQHSDPVVAKLERLGLDVQYEPEAARFDATEGLFWFCNDTYAGQGDPLYSILSTLRFSPSRMSRGPDSDGGQMVYEALEDGSLDPQELMAWIEGRRSNPSAKRRKNPKLTALAGGLIYKCPLCKDAIRLEAYPAGGGGADLDDECEDCGGPASMVAVWDGDDLENGHPVCAACAKRWQQYEDPFSHGNVCDGPNGLRRNPAKKPLAVGKRLVVGDKVVMVTQSHDRVGYTVVVMHGDDVQEQGTYMGRTEALKAATLVYETLKHQGRLNPAPPVHFTDRDTLLDDIQDYQEGYGPAFGETLLRDAGVPDSDIGAMGELMAQLSPVTRDTLAEALRDQVENASAAQIGQYMREREKLLEE